MTLPSFMTAGRAGGAKDLRGAIFLSVVDTYENVDLNRGSCNDVAQRKRVEVAEAVRGRTAVMLVYVSCLRNIHGSLRSYGVEAPVHVAQATICNSPPNETIRAAQRAVVDRTLGILPGPDTDMIGPSDRYDGCHMAESGLVKHAELWTEALTAHRQR